MHVNENKEYGAIRPGFDPKDAKYFWDESPPDIAETKQPAGHGSHANGCDYTGNTENL